MDNGEWDDSDGIESIYRFHAFHAIMITSGLDEEAWEIRFQIASTSKQRNKDGKGPE